jgi:hypothetical protein
MILRCAPEYEERPTFLKEDVAQVCEDEFIASNVSEWMAVSKQVATGNRRRALENGPDKANSSDEDDPDMKPDELTGMIIIIIHLLGLAPAGYLTAPDNGPEGRLWGCASQVTGMYTKGMDPKKGPVTLTQAHGRHKKLQLELPNLGLPAGTLRYQTGVQMMMIRSAQRLFGLPVLKPSDQTSTGSTRTR